MEFSQNLSIKQQQTLSPQTIQSLAILTMPVQELKTYIAEQINSNPALEIPQTEFENPLPDNSNTDCDTNPDDYDSSDYENLNYDLSDSYGEEVTDNHRKIIENALSEKESLSEHLLYQLGCTKTDNKTCDIAKMLIGNLDGNGFFIVNLNTLFEKTDYRQSEIDKAVELVQSFEPYGICCKDFRESLILQAKNSGMQKSDLRIFSEIVNKYLEYLKNEKFREVSNFLNISEEDLLTFYSILKSFTPNPGQNFNTESDSYAFAEVSVHNIDGTLIVDINRSDIPVIEISSEFKNLAGGITGPEAKQTRTYIDNCIKSAETLISQVDMRYKTLYNAMTAIVEKQKDFFLNGTASLKPLRIKDIAEEIGVHETTVSRLANSKWVETDWGTFQLKYFFSKAVRTENGETISRDVVIEEIRKILSEHPKISDQKISDTLAKQGIKCARRTVSKYRSML